MRVTSAEVAALRQRPAARPESEIVKSILEYLRTRRDVVAWRQNSGMAMLPGRGGRPMPVRFGGMKGMSDIVGWQRVEIKQSDGVAFRHSFTIVARILAIEVKRPGKKATPEQQSFLDLVRAHGGLAFVATSVDDVVRELGA